MEHKDQGLVGNEEIEEAILTLQQQPTQEGLAHALTVLRRRARQKGQVIVAVEPSPNGQMHLKTISTADGRLWWYAFTGFEESLKGAEEVKSTFLADLEKLFETVLTVPQVKGVILNPWNRTIQLDKELIRIVLGKMDGMNWQIVPTGHHNC